MSAYPLMLDGSCLDALVVGGGVVAHRKAMALLESGARVRLVASHIAPPIRRLASAHDRLTLEERPYRPGGADIGAATLVIAATDVRAVNAAVARDARDLGRLVNVADRPEDGTCVTAAVHRAGDLVVGVSAGGVPAAAARVRDAIALRLDGRYADVLAALGALRRRLLDAGDASAWHAAADQLVGADFVADVEGGTLPARIAAWPTGAAQRPERAWR